MDEEKKAEYFEMGVSYRTAWAHFQIDFERTQGYLDKFEQGRDGTDLENARQVLERLGQYYFHMEELFNKIYGDPLKAGGNFRILTETKGDITSLEKRLTEFEAC